MEEIKLKLRNAVNEMFETIDDFNDWVDVGYSEIEIIDTNVSYNIIFKLVGFGLVESSIKVYENIPKDGELRWWLSFGDVRYNAIADILKPYFTDVLIDRYEELNENEN